MRAFVSMASLQKDRSRAIALINGGYALGQTCGPAIQVSLFLKKIFMKHYLIKTIIKSNQFSASFHTPSISWHSNDWTSLFEYLHSTSFFIVHS